MPKRHGRSTLNSRCAASANSAFNPVLPVHRRNRKKRKEKPAELIESDAGGGGGDGGEMSANGDVAGPSRRPRTPRTTRTSPESRNRSAMSMVAVDTSRSVDLNSDGTGPSSSNAVQLTPHTDDESEGRQRTTIKAVRRRRTKSHHRRTLVTMPARPRKPRTPSPQTSQASQDEGEPVAFDAEGYHDTDEYQISADMPDYILTAEHHDRFRSFIKKAKEKVNLTTEKISEFYSTSPSKSEEVPKLPSKIRIGRNSMESWYGSPFPREYVFAKRLEICPFCLWYGRSNLMMAAHYNKCKLRSPPGIEIYRKDNHSVFEVDGHIDKLYCQNLCLISRLFLESKTVFHDTEPFMFYVVTINQPHGMEFAGYFSKEKYSPDRNNLSCIMTLPCYQGKGFGNFLIDLSYAISKKEKWFGGPEEPLSTLGARAYHAYWRYKVLKVLQKKKEQIEGGKGLSIKQIAKSSGIKPQTILDLLDTAKWLDYVKEPGAKKYHFNWNVDWEHVEFFLKEEESKNTNKVMFDEKFLEWKALKHTPKQDGFVELSQREIKADEETLRKKKLMRTPISALKVHGTPTSSTSVPIGSVKKEIRSRSCRTVARNLDKELTKKVMVPDPNHISDDEPRDQKDRKEAKESDEAKEPKSPKTLKAPKERKKVVTIKKGRRRKGKRGVKKRSTQQCADSSVEKIRRKKPDDDPDGTGPTASKTRRRWKTPRTTENRSAASSRAAKTPSSGRGRRRTQTTGRTTYDDSEDGDSESSEDEQKPFGVRRKGRRGKGARRQAPKKVPPKSRENDDIDADEDEKKSDDDGADGKKPKIAVRAKVKPSTIVSGPEKSDLEEDEKKDDKEKSKASDSSAIEPENRIDNIDQNEQSDFGNRDSEFEDEELEELGRDYIIGTPESYHSTPPLSPPPQLDESSLVAAQVEEMDEAPQQLPPQPFEALTFSEENDAAPPLLVSEIQNLAVVENGETQAIESAPPPLAVAGAAPEHDGYSTGDDDAPPRLSPQFGKNEDHEEELEKEKPPQVQMVTHNGMHHEEPQQYHNPMSAGNAAPGPSSLQHMTPGSFSQQMMTPQHPYSHQGPESHQQTTPGSGGVPSCGVPVYNHSTPEQLPTQQQQQQFMSPSMSGMPASVSSVHSVHNTSMEMVPGTTPLQQQHATPSNPPYDILAQMQQKVNSVTGFEQQNQLIMPQHAFTSPPSQNGTVPVQQSVNLPAAPPPTTAAPTTRRRGPQKSRKATSAAAAATAAAVAQQQPVLPVHHNPTMMMPALPMQYHYPIDYQSQVQWQHFYNLYQYGHYGAGAVYPYGPYAGQQLQQQQQAPVAPAPMPAVANQFPQQTTTQWPQNPGYL